LLPLLHRNARLQRAVEDPSEIAELFSDLSATRFPSAHLAARATQRLPAFDALIADVERVKRGVWEFLGSPVSYGSDVDWDVHPVTLARYPDVPWHQLPLIGAVPGDVKCVWELNRHRELVRMAQGYMLLRDESLAERIAALLARWMDQNPPGRGINWASSLEVAYRAIAWCWIWHLTRTSAVWRSQLFPRFLWFLWHHARHVERYDSIHHSPNTHLTGEALGMLYVGLLFPEFRRSIRWVTIGAKLLVSELDYQVLGDGMHFERATGYHRYTVEIYTHGAVLARAFGLGISEPIEAALPAMLRVSQVLARPNGTWPILGDEDSGAVIQLALANPDDQRPLLAVNAGLLDDPQWSLGVGAEARAAGWWLLDDESWNALESMPTTAELPATEFAFGTSGYHGARESGTSNPWYCVVDGGPHGGEQTGHAHTDLGHVEIARGDLAIIADPGSSSYTADLDVRNNERSERAHACLVLSGSELASPRGPFSWHSVAATPQTRSGVIDGAWWCEVSYSRPGATSGSSTVRHRRTIVLVRSLGVIIHDEVEGASTVDAYLHWPIPHAINSLVRERERVQGPGFAVNWANEPGLRDKSYLLEESSYSPAYGVRQPATLLRLALPKSNLVTLVTTFTEHPADVALNPSNGREVTITSGSSGARLTLRGGEPPKVRRIGSGWATRESAILDSSTR
jgi:hypothetical protein